MKNNIFKIFGKNFAFGLIALLMSVVVIAIWVFGTMIVGSQDIKWDITSTGMYSIGDTTKTMLQDLKKDVEIIVLLDGEKMDAYGNAGFILREFLEKYDKYPRVTVNYLDPDKNPNAVKELDKDGSLSLAKSDFVVKSGSKIKKIPSTNFFVQDEYGGAMFQGEQNITGAIKNVISDKTPVIYFLEGHKERSLDTEFKVLSQSFKSGNYDSKKINLLVEEKVPEDAEILMVTGPKTDLSQQEEAKLKKYLDEGGKAIFLFDPLTESEKLPRFESVLEKYNIALNYDRIQETDENYHVPGRPFDILVNTESNEITKEVPQSNGFAVLLPESMSLNLLMNSKEPLTQQRIFYTFPSTISVKGDVAGEDASKGAYEVGVAAQYSDVTTSKVFVVGNCMFATDSGLEAYQQYTVNGVLILRQVIKWMSNVEDDLFIMGKADPNSRLIIKQSTANMMVVLTLIVIPLLLCGTGMFVWMRRRHL